MTGNVRHCEPLRNQLPENRCPTAAVEFSADAERLQSVVSEPGNTLGFDTEQDVDEVMRAKALSGAVDR